MQEPEYLAIAQQVSAIIMERDMKAAALEIQRKNVKELQGVEAKILAVQWKAMETSIKYEEKSDKIIRDLKLMNDTTTMDLMSDGGFDDSEDSGDDSGEHADTMMGYVVEEIDRPPPAYRPPPYNPAGYDRDRGGGGYAPWKKIKKI
jgi:hypothetical protein